MTRGVVPEINRHTGHGLGDHHFADGFQQGISRFVPCFYAGAQGPALDFAGPNRQGRAAPYKSRTHIGAAAHRTQPKVGFDVLINPVESFRGQGRTRGTNGTQRIQIELFTRFKLLFHARNQKRRAGAKMVDGRLLGQLPERIQIRVGRAAVVQNHGGSRQERSLHEIPHHPAGGGKPEEIFARADVVVERQVFVVFQQHAAMSVRDGLGQTGGAGRIQNPDGVVERHGLKFDADDQFRGRFFPQNGIRQICCFRQMVEIRDEDHFFQRRQLFAQLLCGLRFIVRFSVVGIAVHNKKQFGFNLQKAVHYAADAKIRRTTRPYRTDGTSGQKSHRRFRNIGQKSHNPVAFANALLPHPGAQSGHLLPERSPANCGEWRVFRSKPDGWSLVGIVFENVFSVVQRAAFKPFCIRHGRV